MYESNRHPKSKGVPFRWVKQKSISQVSGVCEMKSILFLLTVCGKVLKTLFTLWYNRVMNKIKFEIEQDTTWRPLIYLTISPQKNPHGSVETQFLGLLIDVANRQGIHIKPFAVRGDYLTGNREHLHVILSGQRGEDAIDIKLLKRLIRGSGLNGLTENGTTISEYDKRRGGVFYNYGKHNKIEAFVVCPRKKKACRKRKSRSAMASCIHRRREMGETKNKRLK
jgi:hypothetical protein